jgi:hypothetical protein
MALIKLNNKAVSNATAFGSISSLGSMTFIKKLTASSSATLSFVHGTDGVVLDDTYKEYVFTFNNIHPASNNRDLMFQGGASYNTTITSTMFRPLHAEADNDASLGYTTAYDQAQGTAFQVISGDISGDADGSMSGSLTLFNPSSTTFVKHFIANTNAMWYEPYSIQTFLAGYFNTTTAISQIQFKMDSGNIDAGDICLYGIA